MARRRRRSRPPQVKHYVLIALACAAVALVIQYLSTVPDRVQTYAEQRVDEAVRKAVRAEVQEATENH